jgi:hypothetical protein
MPASKNLHKDGHSKKRGRQLKRLYLVPHGRFRELDPLAGNSKPRLLIERADRLFSVLPCFLGLLSESGCIVV